MAEILMAAQSAAVTLEDGIPHMIEAGRTMAHADHPIVTSCPNLWQTLKVHYSTDQPDAEPAPEPVAQPEPEAAPVVESEAEPSPAEESQPEGSASAQPDAKAVRAWAGEQGIEVPARGKVPDAVAQAFLKASQGA